MKGRLHGLPFIFRFQLFTNIRFYVQIFNEIWTILT